MGGFKHEQKHSTQPEVQKNATGSTGNRCLSCFTWAVTILTLFGSFGFLYYVQFHEIQKLKSRIDNLELSVAFGEDDTNIKINSNLHALIQAEVQSNLPALLGGVDEVCAGKQGEQRSHVVRQVVTSQSCCSALQPAGYIGSKTEVITAYIGQDVNLPCNSTGFPKPTISFSPTVDPTGNNRYALTSDGLEIQKAQTSDSGTFTCVVENIFGKEIKNIQLIVTDPVVVTTSPSNILIKEGDTLVIRCRATGSPAPAVTWSHRRPDGTVLQVIGSTGGHVFISSDNTLTITNAKASDAGTYTCTGNNQYEKDSSTTSVSLNGSPEIINPPRTQVVMEGSTVTLFCTVVSSPPATITWTYPLTGNNLPLNGHINADNSLTLSNVDRFNNGEYTCTATNTQGAVTSKATLTVEKGVTVTTTPHLQPLTGREPVLNFQCTADGDPIPITTWSKVGGAPLIGNSHFLTVGSNLIIPGPNINTDTGIYECRGENRNGNNTDRVIVYKELGAITCGTTFASVGCDQDMTCGANCPSLCDPSAPGDAVYGDAHYYEGSSICLSAYHRGLLPAPGSTRVLFTHKQTGTFASSLKNGVQSLSDVISHRRKYAPSSCFTAKYRDLAFPGTGIVLGIFLFGVYGLYMKIHINVFKFERSNILNDFEGNKKDLANDDVFSDVTREQNDVIEVRVDFPPDGGRLPVAETTTQSSDDVTQSSDYDITRSTENVVTNSPENASAHLKESKHDVTHLQNSSDNIAYETDNTNSDKSKRKEFINNGGTEAKLVKNDVLRVIENDVTDENKTGYTQFTQDKKAEKDAVEINSEMTETNENKIESAGNKSEALNQILDEEFKQVPADMVNNDGSQTVEARVEELNSTKKCENEDYTINFDENFGQYIFADNDVDDDVTSNAERIKKDEEIFKTFPNYQNETKYLIYYCDVKCGGLGDRLKGITMVYMMSLLTKRRCALNMTSPCDLEQFLTPNLLDWRPPSRNFTRGKKMVILDYFERYEAFKIDYLKDNIDPMKTMTFDLVLMRSNQHWVREFRTLTISPERFPQLYTYHSSELFRIIYRGLFKSTKMLQNVVDGFMTEKAEGRKLACLHARMGNEAEGYVRYNQPEMMNALNFLEQFDKPEEYKIFVATDNQEIKNIAKNKFKSIVDTSGPVAHIDFMNGDLSRDTKCSGFMRTMVDHVILRQCETLVVTASGFGVTAAMLRHSSRGLHVFTEAKEVLPTKTEILREVYQWRCIWRHWGFFRFDYYPGICDS